MFYIFSPLPFEFQNTPVSYFWDCNKYWLHVCPYERGLLYYAKINFLTEGSKGRRNRNEEEEDQI